MRAGRAATVVLHAAGSKAAPPLRQNSAISAHRPGDVLDLLLAHVLERNGELVAHLIPYHPADADAARFGQGLKARCDVDTVAEDVVVVDDDVAEIDADAQIDASLGLHAGVACGHLALHVDRATNRIDHARELADLARSEHAALEILNSRAA